VWNRGKERDREGGAREFKRKKRGGEGGGQTQSPRGCREYDHR